MKSQRSEIVFSEQERKLSTKIQREKCWEGGKSGSGSKWRPLTRNPSVGLRRLYGKGYRPPRPQGAPHPPVSPGARPPRSPGVPPQYCRGLSPLPSTPTFTLTSVTALRCDEGSVVHSLHLPHFSGKPPPLSLLSQVRPHRFSLTASRSSSPL